VEVGLHVCFPHYRNVLGLLDEIGASDGLEWGASALNYVHANGDVAQLRFHRLPAPLHGALALARHHHLSARDLLFAVLGAAEATLSTSAWRSRYESISFAEWAHRRGLSRRVIECVFEPMVGGLTFLRGDEVSARAMLDYIHAVAHRAAHCKWADFVPEAVRCSWIPWSPTCGAVAD
jgi:15-cis-phytoene desaturase